MVGYKLLDVDRQKIVNDPHLQRFICPTCTFLVKQPLSLPCGRHICCNSCFGRSCKEGDSSVAVHVCPEDGQKFLLPEALYPDERAERQVMSIPISCTFKCNNGVQCEWYGQVRDLETHLRDYHWNGEEVAKIKKAPSQHDTQLPNPALVHGAVPGPSGVSQDSSLQNLPGPDGEQSWQEVAETLLCQQSMDHNDIEQLKQQLAVLSNAYATEKRHREQLQDVVRTLEGKRQVLEQKQSVDRIDITQLKQQLPAIGHAVVTGKQDYEQLQARVRIVEGQVQDLQTGNHLEQLNELKQQLVALTVSLATEIRHGEQLQEEVRAAVGKVQVLEQQQRLDQNTTEELKRQLAQFADAFAVEKRDRERLQEDVRRADGKIQALQQELEGQKNRCASAQDECVTERARGIEALNIESGLLQDAIGRLQSGQANLQRSQADLEERFRRFEYGQGL